MTDWRGLVRTAREMIPWDDGALDCPYEGDDCAPCEYDGEDCLALYVRTRRRWLAEVDVALAQLVHMCEGCAYQQQRIEQRECFCRRNPTVPDRWEPEWDYYDDMPPPDDCAMMPDHGDIEAREQAEAEMYYPPEDEPCAP